MLLDHLLSEDLPIPVAFHLPDLEIALECPVVKYVINVLALLYLPYCRVHSTALLSCCFYCLLINHGRICLY